MVRLLICVCFILVFTVLSSAKPANNGYSSKYDHFDVQGVLASKRLVLKYGDCLMERGPCPPEGRFLKGELVFIDIFFVFIKIFLKVMKF